MRTVLTFALLLVTATAARAAPPPETDRKAILAMAGDYRVKFDFRETTSFLQGYTPIPPKVSGGHEVVRVAEERPGFISLQHLLVVGDDSAPTVVKHWRQDWTFEPATVLAYTGPDRWTKAAVPAAERAGAWSQTVWQTDDSPRYGGVGRWSHANGVSQWTSAETRRPLARRDATRHPPYRAYLGLNRHALTPTGWVHEQDNAKLGIRDGREVVFVHEAVVNTYTRDSKFPVKAAEDYWRATAPYWAEVRSAWDAAGSTLAVREEPENGSMTGPKLMGLADEIAEGRRAVPAAVAEAKTVIAAETRAGVQRATLSPVRKAQGSSPP